MLYVSQPLLIVFTGPYWKEEEIRYDKKGSEWWKRRWVEWDAYNPINNYKYAAFEPFVYKHLYRHKLRSSLHGCHLLKFTFLISSSCRCTGISLLPVVHGRQQSQWRNESVRLLYRSSELLLQLPESIRRKQLHQDAGKSQERCIMFGLQRRHFLTFSDCDVCQLYIL